MIGLLPTTTNAVENLHAKMNKYIPSRRPTVSAAIAILKKFEDRGRRALLQHANQPERAFRGRKRTRQHTFELSLRTMGEDYLAHERTRPRIIKFVALCLSPLT
jgi:hypothetical protein